MRLPALSVIIASQLVIWCIAGAAIHGWMILLYPLSWLVIGSAFYFHLKKHPIETNNACDTPKQEWANSQKPSQKGDGQQLDDAEKPQKVGG